MKKLSAFVLLVATLGQPLAMAYDSEKYLENASAFSIEARDKSARLLDRVNSVSDEQKLSLLKLVSKRLKKATQRLAKSDENKFAKSISKISKFNEPTAADQVDSNLLNSSVVTDENQEIANSPLVKEMTSGFDSSEQKQVSTSIFSKLNKSALLESSKSASEFIGKLQQKTAAHAKWSISDVVHFCEGLTLISILLLILSTIVLLIMGLGGILAIVALGTLGFITLMCIIVCTLRTIDYKEFYTPLDFLFCSIIFCGA